MLHGEGSLPAHEIASWSGGSCWDWESATQESEALIEDLKESYGYTSNLKV